MNGTVTGGWGFVWSAYLLTATVLGIYAVRTIAFFREHSRR
jgi:hypothetical protein